MVCREPLLGGAQTFGMETVRAFGSGVVAHLWSMPHHIVSVMIVLLAASQLFCPPNTTVRNPECHVMLERH